jgi:predicted transcriptional regulator
MKVKDVMHHAATWIGPEATLREVAAHLPEEDLVPISKYDRLVGEVTTRDLTARAGDGKRAEHLTAHDVMSRPIVYCYPEEDTADALRIMRKHALKRLPVVSHQKRIVGTVWLSDVGGEGAPATR